MKIWSISRRWWSIRKIPSTFQNHRSSRSFDEMVENRKCLSQLSTEMIRHSFSTSSIAWTNPFERNWPRKSRRNSKRSTLFFSQPSWRINRIETIWTKNTDGKMFANRFSFANDQRRSNRNSNFVEVSVHSVLFSSLNRKMLNEHFFIASFVQLDRTFVSKTNSMKNFFSTRFYSSLMESKSDH